MDPLLGIGKLLMQKMPSCIDFLSKIERKSPTTERRKMINNIAMRAKTGTTRKESVNFTQNPFGKIAILSDI